MTLQWKMRAQAQAIGEQGVVRDHVKIVCKHGKRRPRPAIRVRAQIIRIFNPAVGIDDKNVYLVIPDGVPMVPYPHHSLN